MSRQHEYSQHFLRSPRLVAELIGHSNLKKRDIVYDIGAGSGVITSVLARRVNQVFAVEIEADALRKLRKNIEEYENVTVIDVDAMALVMPKSDYKVFANIPFSLSAKIIEKLTSDKNAPQAIYLIVQKQFANKLLPENDGFSSQMGMILGANWQVRIRKRLHKSDFTPPPAVDTVLLELLPREVPLIRDEMLDAYKEFIKKSFTDPTYFARLKLAPGYKPSQMRLSDWVGLFGRIKL